MKSSEITKIKSKSEYNNIIAEINRLSNLITDLPEDDANVVLFKKYVNLIVEYECEKYPIKYNFGNKIYFMFDNLRNKLIMFVRKRKRRI